MTPPLSCLTVISPVYNGRRRRRCGVQARGLGKKKEVLGVRAGEKEKEEKKRKKEEEEEKRKKKKDERKKKVDKNVRSKGMLGVMLWLITERRGQ